MSISIICRLFSGTKREASFTLHHHDLNAANILVDPKTFEIIGIVYWELISVVPEWRASEHPRFLDYIEPTDEEEPPIPSYENENHIAVELRNRWDYRILRCHFDEAMKRLTRNDSIINDTMRTKAKLDCHGIIPELTGTWNWSQQWLKTYKRTVVSKNGADRAKEMFGENESDDED